MESSPKFGKQAESRTTAAAEKSDDAEEKAKILERAKSIKQEMAVSNLRLRDMQGELPAQSNGFYLNLILGSNLNVSLLTKLEKFKYKQEYEGFKWNITILICVLTLTAWMWPFRVLDSILCFLLVWYYCTLTIRESVLRVNGSKIKGWWLSHHYLSCAGPGIVLTWKDGVCYQDFRIAFLTFLLYISIVQLAQNQYQSGCLRRLHALGQGHQMDITVEGFTSWQFKGLTFLLPFLTIGYLFQLYLAWRLYGYTSTESCDGLWQVWALSLLLGLIAVGNIVTTSMVCIRKFKTTPSYTNIVALTRKYNSRHKMSQPSEQDQVTSKLHNQ
uniref:Transmembrane protein 120 homolog n=1 Tax=Caenorhabditis japonica TaxID=281687 RepID=A0A8R1HXV9_CAEJA